MTDTGILVAEILEMKSNSDNDSGRMARGGDHNRGYESF